MATGTNGIATNQEIYNKCAVWVDSSQPSRCPTYSQIIGQRLSVNGSYLSAQLVMLYDIYAPSYIRLYIDDWDTILGYCGMSGSNEAHWNFDIWGQHPSDYAGIIFNETPCTYEEEYRPYFEASLQTWIDFHEALNMAGDFSGVTLTCGGADYVPNDLENFETVLTALIETGEDQHMNWMSSGDSGSSGSGGVQDGTMDINVRVRLIGFRDASDEAVFSADPLNVVITNDSGQTRTFSSPYIYEDYESANTNDYSINLGTWSGMTYTNLSQCSFAVSVDNGYTTSAVKTYVRSIHNGQTISPIISGSELDNGYVLKGSLGRTWTGIEIVICANENSIPLNSYFIVENPWPISTKNPNPNDYFAFESPKITHKEVTIMRIRPVHKTNFNLWIRSYAESSWDFAIAGRINNALSSDYTAYSSTNPGLAWTKSNQKSGYTEADHTAVSYSCSYHDNNFVDIAYRKDSNGDYNDDKGYCLMHYTDFY